MTAAGVQRPSILCVDDEPRVLDSLSRLLRREFNVHVAASGADALRTLRERGPFEVVMSDMRMPGMDGVRLLRLIRQLSPCATRVLLTGQADSHCTAVAIEDGTIAHFLTKPCPPDVLLPTLRAAAHASRHRSGTTT